MKTSVLVNESILYELLLVRTSVTFHLTKLVVEQGMHVTRTTRFVEYFAQIMPSKSVFKSFNLEKINRQTGSKQVMIRSEKTAFPAKAMR